MKAITLATLVALSTLSAMQIGCQDAATQGSAPPGPVAQISPIMRWRITGSPDNVTRAIDNNLRTYARAAAGSGQATITIDLGKQCLFNMVTLEHGSVENGHARQLVIMTSLDDKEYTTHVRVEGTPRRTYLSILTPTLARFVRIRATVADDRPWTVAEVHLQ